MYITYKKTKIFYEIQGVNGSFLTFFHGWGSGAEILKPLAKEFFNYRKLFIDFSPFGKSEEHKSPWTLEDYVNCVLKIFKKEKVQKTKIICHSFGGRVAILLAKKYNGIEGLVLMASAGMKPRKSFFAHLKILRYKILKKLGKNTDNFGSTDYLALSKTARKTFVNIVNLNLEKECKNVKCKTLIIAGKRDRETPLYMQKKLHKLIAGSKLVVLKNAGHFVWLNSFFQVVQNIKTFFESVK